MRLRLHRDLNAPFEKDGHEYGNYEKYQSDSNSVKVESELGEMDDGQSKFFKNYQDMLKSMDIEEGEKSKEVDRKTIKSTIENYRV